jgi:CTP:molybdopterin cytidylyltransferase MocA
MGSFKPLLPFGSLTIIERVISILREAGVDTIRVVVGWNAHLVVPVLERCGVAWVTNEQFADGMYSSIQDGVRGLPPTAEAFFLMPGDMPHVRGATLARLATEWDAQPGGILYPSRGGRRGHPPLIGAAYLPEILHETPAGGLRELLRRHAGEARDIEVPDPGILLDLDTPEDYRNTLETYYAVRKKGDTTINPDRTVRGRVRRGAAARPSR